MNKLGLYFHIPYCIKKCNYCSFVSGCNFSNTKNYFETLNKEIELFVNDNKIDEYVVDTIFIGGGTPSAVDGVYIKNLLQTVSSNFKVDKIAEISIECNPDSLNADKLDIYLKSGINRISVGIQSLNDSLLKIIGRPHDSAAALSALKLVKSAGFKNINCDIMLNLPNQTYDDVLKTVNGLFGFDIQHISAYSLSLEEGTPMYNSEISLDEDYAADIYEKLNEYLDLKGFKRYEVSNFAKDGFKCKHNLKYWKRLPYIGFGVAAHSFFYETRLENTSNTDEYITKIKNRLSPVINATRLDGAEKELEYIICNLRLEEGFNLEEFKDLFESDFLIKYEKQLKKVLPFINIGKNVKVKKDSFYILNSILTEIIY